MQMLVMMTIIYISAEIIIILLQTRQVSPILQTLPPSSLPPLTITFKIVSRNILSQFWLSNLNCLGKKAFQRCSLGRALRPDQVLVLMCVCVSVCVYVPSLLI